MVLAALTFSGSALAANTPEAPAPGEAQAAPKSKAAQLDDLFLKLQTEKDETAAKAAETAILTLWLESGSDTVDLLMGWSMQAMAAKDYGLALDYLDRITVLKPDYVEGWNKRATVYFLLQDYAKSIADIQKTLALEPRHFGALAGFGVILDSLGDKRRAIDAYKKALAADPRLDEVRKALEKLEKETERDI